MHFFEPDPENLVITPGAFDRAADLSSLSNRPCAWAETIHGRLADADAPHLGLRVASTQALASGQEIFLDLEVSRAHVNGATLKTWTRGSLWSPVARNPFPLAA